MALEAWKLFDYTSSLRDGGERALLRGSDYSGLLVLGQL